MPPFTLFSPKNVLRAVLIFLSCVGAFVLANFLAGLAKFRKSRVSVRALRLRTGPPGQPMRHVPFLGHALRRSPFPFRRWFDPCLQLRPTAPYGTPLFGPRIRT